MLVERCVLPRGLGSACAGALRPLYDTVGDERVAALRPRLVLGPNGRDALPVVLRLAGGDDAERDLSVHLEEFPRANLGPDAVCLIPISGSFHEAYDAVLAMAVDRCIGAEIRRRYSTGVRELAPVSDSGLDAIHRRVEAPLPAATLLPHREPNLTIVFLERLIVTERAIRVEESRHERLDWCLREREPRRRLAIRLRDEADAAAKWWAGLGPSRRLLHLLHRHVGFEEADQIVLAYRATRQPSEQR